MFVAALLLAVGLGFVGGRRSVTRPLLERVDTVTVRDTSVDYRPAPLSVTPLRAEAVRLPLSGLAFARFADDTTSVGDTVFLKIRDTVEVEVPIVFSRYRGDNYDIGVSGFRTELEFVKVYPETKVVTQTISVPSRNRSHWALSLQAGYGITLQNNRITPLPYIGAGISYNLIEW